MKLQVLSVFWGENHFDIFKWAVRSLSFEKNKQALYELEATWNIFAEDAFVPRVKELMKVSLPRLNVRVFPASDLMAHIDATQAALVWQIEECIKTKSRFLLVPPDTIFGDGTVHALVKAGREERTCVAVAHPRVLPDICHEIKGASIPNDELVSLFLKYQHQSWTDAEEGRPRQNTFCSGIKWHHITPKLIGLTHFLPTCYFCDFTDEDLQYFKLCGGFGNYDHSWPGEILLRQHRQRLIGSSDAAFVVELTERDKNVPKVWEGSVDDYWELKRYGLHANKLTQVVFRGKE